MKVASWCVIRVRVHESDNLVNTEYGHENTDKMKQYNYYFTNEGNIS